MHPARPAPRRPTRTGRDADVALTHLALVVVRAAIHRGPREGPLRARLHHARAPISCCRERQKAVWTGNRPMPLQLPPQRGAATSCRAPPAKLSRSSLPPAPQPRPPTCLEGDSTLEVGERRRRRLALLGGQRRDVVPALADAARRVGAGRLPLLRPAGAGAHGGGLRCGAAETGRPVGWRPTTCEVLPGVFRKSRQRTPPGRARRRPCPPAVLLLTAGRPLPPWSSMHAWLPAPVLALPTGGWWRRRRGGPPCCLSGVCTTAPPGSWP